MWLQQCFLSDSEWGYMSSNQSIVLDVWTKSSQPRCQCCCSFVCNHDDDRAMHHRLLWERMTASCLWLTSYPKTNCRNETCSVLSNLLPASLVKGRPDGMPTCKSFHLASIAQHLAKTDARSAHLLIHKMCFSFSSSASFILSLLGCEVCPKTEHRTQILLSQTWPR